MPALAPENVAQHELTSPHVKELAGRGLDHPDKLARKEVQEICGSVMAHIIRLKKQMLAESILYKILIFSGLLPHAGILRPHR